VVPPQRPSVDLTECLEGASAAPLPLPGWILSKRIPSESAARSAEINRMASAFEQWPSSEPAQLHVVAADYRTHRCRAFRSQESWAPCDGRNQRDEENRRTGAKPFHL